MHLRKLATRVALGGLASLPLWGATVGCASSKATHPKSPEEGVSREAEREIASLELLWASRPVETQGSLVDPTRRLLAQHPKASEVSQLRLFLANHLFRERRLVEAEALLTPIVTGREGITQDEALILLGEIRIEQNRGDEALKLLSPLGPRLLTDEARGRYAEVMVRAALRARRWRVGVAYLVFYLSETHQKRDSVLEFLHNSLDQVPVEAKRRLLTDLPTEEQEGAKKAASETVARVLVEGLVERALAESDPTLARDLVDHGPAWVRRGERGERIVLLAARAMDRVQVVRRMIGTVLGGSSPFANRRSVEAASGIAEILDSTIELTTEDDRGSIAESLAALLGQGAGILIAGVDETSALEALQFAELHRVPLLALESPEVAPATAERFGFIVAPSRHEQYEALARELGPASDVTGIGTKARHASLNFSCDTLGASSLPSLLQGPTAWFVLGDRACAEKVTLHFRDLKHPPKLGLSLEAAEGRPRGTYYLQSGRYPAPDPEHGNSEKSAFYRALARDAARLASRALTDTPLPTSSDSESWHRYHDALREALSMAQAELETSTASGLDGKLRLERTYRVEVER